MFVYFVPPLLAAGFYAVYKFCTRPDSSTEDVEPLLPLPTAELGASSAYTETADTGQFAPQDPRSLAALQRGAAHDSVYANKPLNDPSQHRHFTPASRGSIGWAETQGYRPSMEDAVVVRGGWNQGDLYAVFDGHGGAEASALCATELPDLLEDLLRTQAPQPALHQVCLDLHQRVVDPDSKIQCGTTALIAYIQESTGWVANVGDSRAVLGLRDGGVRRVTRDHKATDPDEAARCREKGAFVVRGRIMGMIAISRAIGDAELADFLIQDPDVFSFDTSNVDLVILACDGVWDVLSDEQAMEIVRSTLDPGTAAQRLRDAAIRHGSRDNVSVIVVHVREP